MCIIPLTLPLAYVIIVLASDATVDKIIDFILPTTTADENTQHPQIKRGGDLGKYSSERQGA